MPSALQLCGAAQRLCPSARVGVRRASSSAQQQATAAAGRLEKLAEPLMYYGRVGGAFLAQVARSQQLGPPTPAEWPLAQKGAANFIAALRSGAWRSVKVTEAGQYALKAVEVAGFFFVGEIIGRGSLVGYNVGSAHGHGHH